MRSIVYKACSRGHQQHGWLDAYHTFSFANYYNPKRMNFGALRVLNDDVILGGEGFGKHPHDNMEIVTIPLYGRLEHQDSMGYKEVIVPGEVQVMSAGSGIMHSEYNADTNESLNLFQIWIFPNKENVTPRYNQKKFDFEKSKNELVQVVSPEKSDDDLWLNQDTWFNIGYFDQGVESKYNLRKAGNGVFAMVIEGKFQIGDQHLERRDAMGIYDTSEFSFKALSDDARILLIEVPMMF